MEYSSNYSIYTFNRFGICSLVATVLSLGFLIFRVIKANKDYPARVNASLSMLNQSMVELADYKQFYIDSSEKKEILLSKVEYL